MANQVYLMIEEKFMSILDVIYVIGYWARSEYGCGWPLGNTLLLEPRSQSAPNLVGYGGANSAISITRRFELNYISLDCSRNPSLFTTSI